MRYDDLIGVPYKIHGRSKEEGFDCYGLLIELMKRDGVTLPDYLYKTINKEDSMLVYQQAINGIPHIKLDKPIPKCLVLMNIYGEARHIGMYIGAGRIIHTMKATGVIIENLKRWENRINGFYKVEVS